MTPRNNCISIRLLSVDKMSWFMINGVVILVFVSDALAGLNIINTVANLTSRPFENVATNIKDFTQLASENGCSSEKHEVTTNDGYILTMFRIPPGSKCTKKTPILLMHDVLEASENFIVSGQESPAVLLAQECYDVWLGNARGNTHSRKHEALDPDKNVNFWKFSTDEMGLYDTPAMIDYILDTTDTTKLIYLGFAQGSTSFFIMNSEKPEYADKVSLFVGLAPATRQYYTRSLLYRTGTVAVKSLQSSLETVGIWEILSRGMPIQTIGATLCQIEFLAAVVCGPGLFVVDSPHVGSITPLTYVEVFQHDPAGTSIQNLAKLGQAMDSLKFVKFDYGSRNIDVYGELEPPEYDLGPTTSPTVIFHGLADHLVDTRDVDWTVGQLPNVVEYVKVEDPLWNHFDMVYNQYWKDVIFAKLKKYLSKYDSVY